MVGEFLTHVTLLASSEISVFTIDTDGRTVGLNVTNTSARVALFGLGAPRARAIDRLMSWLPAVVAKAHLGRTSLSNVSHCTIIIVSNRPLVK